jgi:hypothetical protein
MSDTTTSSPNVPLGVGQIISESFSILFGNIVAVAVAAFVPMLLMIVLSGLTIGFGVALGIEDPDPLADGFFMGIFLNTVVSMAIYGIVTAIIVQLAFDAKLGRGTNFGKYASTAISTLIPNVVQVLIVTIAMSFAMLAFIVPGLWVWGVFAVTVPALVIERVGFGAMRRSAELTKEYRWPVIGTMIVVFVGATILSLIPSTILGLFVTSLNTPSIVLVTVLMAIIYTFTYGLIGIATALVYARLRDIKEGISVDDLTSVFE